LFRVAINPSSSSVRHLFHPFNPAFSGPFKLNGVPLRRVNQAYTIATSTKVDVSAVNVSAFDDAFFTKSGKSVKAQKQADFLAAGQKAVRCYLTQPVPNHHPITCLCLVEWKFVIF
jgi:hypothetical protein